MEGDRKEKQMIAIASKSVGHAFWSREDHFVYNLKGHTNILLLFLEHLQIYFLSSLIYRSHLD